MISMIGMLASVGLNIILDPILIFGFDLNVVGAALGTAISNVAAALFFIIYFMKNSDVVSVNIKLAKPNKEMLSEIFKIGILHFNEYLNGIHRISFKFILAHYGNFAIASYGISFRLVQFPELIIMGLCEGVVPLIAYNFMSNIRSYERRYQSSYHVYRRYLCCMYDCGIYNWTSYGRTIYY